MTTTSATIPKHDAWLLACYLSSVKAVDSNAVKSPFAQEAAKAMSNGKAPNDAFDDWLKTLAPEIAVAVSSAVYAEDPGVEPPETDDSTKIVHWADEALEPQLPQEELVKGLISKESVNLVYGAPGSKKTWVMILLAICIAAGLDWLGFNTEQGTVLIVDEESGQGRTNKRLKQLMDGLGIGKGLPLAYTSLVGFNLRETEYVEKLIEVVESVKPSLVIVDALADVMIGGDENSAKDVQPVMQSLRRIANKYQLAIIVIHHENKQGGMRGSIAIPGAIELALRIESKPNSDVIEFETTKTRDIGFTKFAAQIEFNEAADTVVIRSTTPKPKAPNYTRAENYVLDFLQKHSQALLQDIERQASACSPASARKAVYSLAGKGIIRRCDDGKQGAKATYEMTPIKGDHLMDSLI